MGHVRPLDFESLEARELLSRAHHPAVHRAKTHTRPAVAAAPLVIDGTLTINNHAATSNTNMDSSSTMSVPVRGQFAGLGAVSGVWNESTDVFGEYLGPDTITLHGSQGSFTIAFSNASPGPAHRTGPHAVYYQHAMHIEGGTGAYRGDTGTGTINLNMNAAHTMVQSITINAQSQ